MVLGYALLCEKQTDQAVKALTLAARRHPRNATLQCLLGKAHAAAGDQASARRHYYKAAGLEKDNELARLLLADANGGTPEKTRAKPPN